MFHDLPPEIVNLIIEKLTAKEAIPASTVSKNFLSYIQHTLWKRARAKSYEDFLVRVEPLDEWLKWSILDEQNTLAFAEETQKILRLPKDQRFKFLDDKVVYAIRHHPDASILEPAMLNDIWIIALREKLIRPEHIAAITDTLRTSNLSYNAVKLLRNKLITPDLLMALPFNCNKYFYNLNALIALGEGLVRPEQLTKMHNLHYLEPLLHHDNGLLALRDKLITLEQADTMKNRFYLNYLLSDNGIIALHEGLITPEQAAAMRNEHYLKYLLSDNGLIALREGLITPKQAASMSSEYYLENLLSDLGIVALREKLITAEQASVTINLHDIFDLLVNKMPKKIQILLDRSGHIDRGSPEAYAFIRQSLIAYSQADVGKPLAATARFLAGAWSTYNCVTVGQLLLKDEYSTFDQKSLKNFFAELKNIIDFKTLNKEDDLYAILIVAKPLVQVDICLTEAKGEKLDSFSKRHKD